MAGNTFGRLFAVTTFGESHGAAIGCVVDGCPPGMELTNEDIQKELDRRRPGSSRFVTQRKESDQVEILSGIYEGKTTGTPIALLIRNTDQRSKDYSQIAQLFRPGHADYTYTMKYGIRDPRGGGRSSARLTAATVAAGAIAKKWLSQNLNIKIEACLTQVGTLVLPKDNWESVNQNAFFMASDNKEVLASLENLLDEVRKAGDSIGASVKVRAKGVPVGLGSPLFEKLDGQIASAMMNINAVKAVAIGDGFDVVTQKGSTHGDEMNSNGFVSNHAGGILGGISTGQTICVSLAIKPTPSIHQAKNTINVNGQNAVVETTGRHDPCVGIRAVPVAEAMLSLVLMDAYLMHRAQCADVKHIFKPLDE